VIPLVAFVALLIAARRPAPENEPARLVGSPA
jgi:hypothetical protein